jgi:hypothetical protein
VCLSLRIQRCTRGVVTFADLLDSVPSLLAGGLFRTSLLASNSSIEAPLQPVELRECICKGRLRRRQPIC